MNAAGTRQAIRSARVADAKRSRGRRRWRTWLARGRTADTLLAELRQAPEVGLTRTEMFHLFNRNKTAGEIGESLRLLADNNLARAQSEVDPMSGRTVERWFPILTN